MIWLPRNDNNGTGWNTRELAKLTDADTPLGNFVLCTLAIAVVLAWWFL